MTNRAARTQWYVNGSELIGRTRGCADERVLKSEVFVLELAIEGYAALRSKGKSHADIMSGAALPDRTMPDQPKLTELAKGREAIAYAIAEEETKKGFVGVSRKQKEAALVIGREEAAKLSATDVKDQQRLKSVAYWHKELYGEAGSVRRAPSSQPTAD